MITKEEYEKALITIDQYKKEQEEIKNKDRMTVGYFVGRIPVIEGKGGTIRLINILLNIIENNERYFEKGYKNTNEILYMDEIEGMFNEDGCPYRGIGKKTVIQFIEYKNKIINGNIDASSL